MMTELQVDSGREQVEGLTALLAELDALSHTTSEIRVDTRERILEAAIRLFAIHGFEACTVKQIATEVGIKPPGLYAHFPSKEAILSAAMSRELRKFLAYVLEPDDGEDPRTRLEAIVRRHVLYQIENLRSTTSNDLLLNSDAAKAALGDHDYHLFRRAQRAYFDHVRTLVVQTGGQASRRNARVASLALLTLCDRVNSWYQPDGPLGPPDVADEYWRLATGMLALP
ncbi:TetR/AcrR family transcriptional regulator [Rhodococcus koreensis]